MTAIPSPARNSRIRPEILSIGGIEAGVLRMGDPALPPVLLVHGFCGDKLTWQFNLGPLARQHHVVAIDLPGHGRSGSAAGFPGWWDLVDWLAAAVAALALDRPHLVGHSLGGRLLLGLAESGKLVPRSLTLIACAAISRRYDHEFLETMIRIATREDAERCARRLFGAAPLDTALFARGLLATLTQPRLRAEMTAFLARNLPEARHLDTPPIDWTKLSCPLQFIWGRDDPVIELPPPGWLPPHAPSEVLDAVGHMPHVAAADRVTRLLTAFLAEADRQG